MTYIVSSGALNSTHSLTQSVYAQDQKLFHNTVTKSLTILAVQITQQWLLAPIPLRIKPVRVLYNDNSKSSTNTCA